MTYAGILAQANFRAALDDPAIPTVACKDEGVASGVDIRKREHAFEACADRADLHFHRRGEAIIRLLFEALAAGNACAQIFGIVRRPSQPAEEARAMCCLPGGFISIHPPTIGSHG